MSELINSIIEATETFFASDLPERFILWCGTAAEGLVNFAREIIAVFGG